MEKSKLEDDKAQRCVAVYLRPQGVDGYSGNDINIRGGRIRGSMLDSVKVMYGNDNNNNFRWDTIFKNYPHLSRRL